MLFLNRVLAEFGAFWRNERLAILDLDRSLLNTDAFWADFVNAIRDAYGSEEAALLDSEGTTEHLDFMDILERRGIPADEASATFRNYVAKTHGPHHSYLYEGGRELLLYLCNRPHTRTKIFTTGGQASQQVKLSSESLIEQLVSQGLLSTEVTDRNKGEVLEADFSKARGIVHQGIRFWSFIIVDDKESVLTKIKPGRGRHLIHILRNGAKYAKRTNRRDIQEATDLYQVKKLIEGL